MTLSMHTLTNDAPQAVAREVGIGMSMSGCGVVAA